MTNMPVSVAIDGPSGAGKSTLARAIAAKFGFIYVDTGALYRTIGMFMINSGVDRKSSDEVVSHLDKFSLELKFLDGKQVILLD